MSVFNGSTPNPYWFDPLGLHLAVAGASDPAYQWWLNALAGSLGQFYMDMGAFCSGPVPVYPDMNEANIEAVGLKTIYLQWMSEYLYSITSSP